MGQNYKPLKRGGDEKRWIPINVPNVPIFDSLISFIRFFFQKILFKKP